MWFFFSLVIDVQNLFVQIIYELTSPCIDVLSSAEWLAPLFQFIFSYLVANNLLFLQWKVLFLSQASLIHGTPGCTINPLISQLSPIVPTLNVSNYRTIYFLKEIHRIHKWRTRGKKLVPSHESEALEDKQKLQMKTFSELAECLARIPPKITLYGLLFKYS